MVAHTATAATSSPSSVPEINQIGTADLRAALRKGLDDFMAKPSHMVFLSIIYPLVALIASRLTFGYEILPLLFPLCAGLSLVGPVAALGLYEISRRRELGQTPSWYHAMNVVTSPGIKAIVHVALMLAGIFVAWLLAAHLIYSATIGGAPGSIGAFVDEVFTTAGGLSLILIGNGVGLLFAILVLTLTVVSVPMILDRHVSAGTAIRTSIKAVRTNPRAMGTWGAIVGVLLVAGAIPAFVGLAITVPVLGHATWHLYRRTVGQ
jgi:uncharacterized membrane protein